MNGRLHEIWKRILSLSHKLTLDSEFNEELATHIESAIEDNIRAGMNAEEARRNALIKLGGTDQTFEAYRDARGFRWLVSLLGDIRYVLRTFRKSPGFALAFIGTLALGIGTATAIFSAVDQTVLRKPFPHYERLTVFGSDFPGSRSGFTSNSYPIQIMPCVESGKSFDAFAINAWGRGTMSTGSETFGVDFAGVNQDFFSVLNGKTALGRLFRPEDFAQASSSVIVLKHQFWKDYFGGDRNVIGRSVVLENHTYQIVGVLSEEFSPPTMFWSSVFMPLVLTSDPSNPFAQALTVMARLRQGVTLVQANAEASILCAAPDANPRFKARFKNSPLYLKWLSDVDPSRRFSRIHAAFLSAVGFLFAIAVINGINLMFVRRSERKRELGIRLALGSSRGTLMRLIVTESFALNLLAGLLGLILAWTIKPFLVNLLMMSKEALDRGVSLDSRALLFAFGISLLSALIIAAASVWKVSTEDLQSILREGGITTSEGRKLQRSRESLVAISAAMAMVLLTGTGLMTRSVQKLMSVDRGFDPSRKIALWIDLPRALQSAEPRHAVAQRLEERL
jgi:predicted permease